MNKSVNIIFGQNLKKNVFLEENDVSRKQRKFHHCLIVIAFFPLSWLDVEEDKDVSNL
jgi:hypothetical protein